MNRPARIVAQLIRREPKAYALGLVLWLLFHSLPLASGWALKVVLDRVTADEPSSAAWSALAALAGIELGRWALLVVSAVQFTGTWNGLLTVQRVNLLKGLATSGGPVAGRLPSSSGDAASRFRDDARDVCMIFDTWVDISGAITTSAIAIAVMMSIEPLITLGVIAPMAVAAVIMRWFGPLTRAWHLKHRKATAAVTGFIGDTFGAVLAVKSLGAEDAVRSRFQELNQHRARVARRDEFQSSVFQTLSTATGEIGLGLLLLLIAQSARSGDFTVGELALFGNYLVLVADLPRWVGRLAVFHQQGEVSIGRMAELTIDGDARRVVAPVKTYVRHGPPPLTPPDHDVEPFESLSVSGLAVRHEGGRGLDGVDITVRRGELVVLTGAVGAGKSTLLRAVLGLIAVDGGVITWNGEPVEDPAVFLVPPRVAYLPQVPRLFSEPVADTVLLGLPDDDGALDRALWQACLEDDIAEMPEGVRTVVGPKGVRLSGGQLQRVAAARALVRRPQLLVVDDLSSALDVGTESRLWDRILTDDLTALVVTHRPRVIAAADKVIVLEEGRVSL